MTTILSLSVLTCNVIYETSDGGVGWEVSEADKPGGCGVDLVVEQNQSNWS